MLFSCGAYPLRNAERCNAVAVTVTVTATVTATVPIKRGAEEEPLSGFLYAFPREDIDGSP